MQPEQFKFVPWYWDKYIASSYWYVISNFYKEPRPLRNMLQTTWYYQVALTCPYTWSLKRWSVHRIIALTFIWHSNLFVNHIDWIKTNNDISNLEYVTHSENMLHALRTWLMKHNIPKPRFWKDNNMTRIIIQCDKEWNIIQEFESWRAAAKDLWLQTSCICQCASWKRKSTWWYTFKYKE